MFDAEYYIYIVYICTIEVILGVDVISKHKKNYIFIPCGRDASPSTPRGFFLNYYERKNNL